jgi:hypothetical protein
MKQLAIFISCLAVCAASTASPGASKTLAELHALGRHLDCNTDQQCRTVPVGAKSCGGPESYMAYSTAGVSADKAQALAERYRKERVAENQASGLASDCRYLMDPGATCRAGRCQLGGQNGALAE